MSGLVGIVSEVCQGDRVDTVIGPASNKIEREIDLAKEILQSEILVAQPLPTKSESCVIKRKTTQNQKGGRKKTQPTKRSAPRKQSIVKRKKKNV